MFALSEESKVPDPDSASHDTSLTWDRSALARSSRSLGSLCISKNLTNPRNLRTRNLAYTLSQWLSAFDPLSRYVGRSRGSLQDCFGLHGLRQQLTISKATPAANPVHLSSGMFSRLVGSSFVGLAQLTSLQSPLTALVINHPAEILIRRVCTMRGCPRLGYTKGTSKR